MSGIMGPLGVVPISTSPTPPYLAPILDLFPDAEAVALFLAGRPITVAGDYQGAAIAPGFTWTAVEVDNAISTVEVATDYP